MRRALAILALLGTSWPHVMVLECALASWAPGADEASAHHAAPAHAGMHHGPSHLHAAGPLAEAGDDASAGGPRCAMPMACGLPMLRAESDNGTTNRSDTSDTGGFASLDAPSSTELAADPPPPRRRA